MPSFEVSALLKAGCRPPSGGDRRSLGKPVKEGFASFLKGAANIKITF